MVSYLTYLLDNTYLLLDLVQIRIIFLWLFGSDTMSTKKSMEIIKSDMLHVS
jgi:hypothetical protein